ncbi:hypothetical protein M9Y10_024300 [Tritrichomonas musculus]|uniref:Uncharacterized protein n=1 Tax=Tritrichomonas musculus TaxID=1915356 RepID=A0ABR2HCK7_9EUKA
MAHVFAKIHERWKLCERNNAFNGRQIKESVMKAMSENKKNSRESFMTHVVNINNRAKYIQKENPNICNVLEAVSDATSTSVEGLSLGSLILMACEIPYAATDSIHLFTPPPEQQNTQINQNKPNLPE